MFGTKDTKFDMEAKLAQLYLYTVDDNRISVLADKQVCSNGKVIATDERGPILYDIDTPTRKVVRYRLDLRVWDDRAPTSLECTLSQIRARTILTTLLDAAPALG